MNKNFIGYFLLLFQPLFMASNLIVARGGVDDVPPISLSFWRWFIFFIILFVLNYKYLVENFQTVIKESKRSFFLGLMGCGVCGIFPYMAGSSTTIVNMGILYTSSPIFIILISYFLFKDKINTLQFIGLLFCLVGVFAVILKGDINLLLELKFASGDFWMLGAALGWAIYTVMLFQWNSELNFFPRLTIISFFGFLSILPFYFIEHIYFEKTLFNEEFYYWILFAAISPGIIAFSLYTLTIKYLGPSTTGFTLYLYTIYGAFYGIIFFSEILENYHLIGTIFVFFGIYLVRRKSKNEIKA